MAFVPSGLVFLRPARLVLLVLLVLPLLIGAFPTSASIRFRFVMGCFCYYVYFVFLLFL